MPTLGSIAAALDPTAPAPYKQGREYVQRVVLTLTDNYIAGGVTVNLMGLNTPGSNPPFSWHFLTPAADTYLYVPGATRALGKVVVYTGTSEHTDDAAFADATVQAEFRYLPL